MSDTDNDDNDELLDFGIDDNDLVQMHIDAESSFDEGEYELALMQYLKVFEGSRADADWQEKRLTVLLADIAALADVYEPAMETLTSMRNQREEELFAGSCDLATVSEWAAINNQLEVERTLAVYTKLKEDAKKYAAALSLIRQIEASNLISRGLYQELDKATLEYLQKDLLRLEANLLTPSSNFSANSNDDEDNDHIEDAMEALLKASVELFEAAAALKEGDIGRDTMNKYLNYQSTNPYSELIKAAQRAKNAVWLEGLKKLEADSPE